MTDKETRAKEAEAATEETSGWRPSAGDVVSGKITAISKGWSDWSNSFYPLITIRDADGKDVDVHAFHHTLSASLLQNKPKVGDRIEIAYLGKRATKDGKREVAIYRVTMPDATGAEVWDQLDAQPAQAAKAATQGQLPGDEDIPF